MKNKLTKVGLSVLVMLAVLTGCGGQTTAEQMEACIGRTIWKETDVSVLSEVSAADVVLKCADEVGL